MFLRMTLEVAHWLPCVCVCVCVHSKVVITFKGAIGRELSHRNSQEVIGDF